MNSFVLACVQQYCWMAGLVPFVFSSIVSALCSLVSGLVLACVQ